MADEGLEIVAVSDLKLGMFVAEPDCSWNELKFPLQGFVLSENSELEEFSRHCQFVYIDRSFSTGEHYRAPVRERDAPLLAGRPDGLPTGRVVSRERYRKEFLNYLYHQDNSDSAAELACELALVEPQFEDLQHSLHRTMDALKVEDQVDFRQVSEQLEDLSGSLSRNPDALMWLLRLKNADSPSFDQAMNVSIYLLLLGKHVGLAGDKLLELSLAGMLQDVGKTALPQDLFTKAGALDDEERELIRSHVASSLELLTMQGGLSPELLLIVANHHERWDGSGYPRGVSGRQIGRGAEMAGMVDSFCAMMRARPYRAAMGHQEALEAIWNLRNRHFNPALMEQLVQCVGLYPIGTLVELNTGEVGVVIQQNRAQRARPRVLLMLNAQKERVFGYHVIDLRDARAKGYAVLRSLPNGTYGLLGDEYYLG